MARSPRASSETRALHARLAHQPPFRFVDTLLERSVDAAVFGLRWPGPSSWAPAGHSALLLVEALAQSAAAYHATADLAPRAPNAPAGPLPSAETGMLVSIDRARLHGAPHAGDDVVLRVQHTRTLGPLVRFNGIASVDGDTLAEVELTVSRDASRRAPDA